MRRGSFIGYNQLLCPLPAGASQMKLRSWTCWWGLSPSGVHRVSPVQPPPAYAVWNHKWDPATWQPGHFCPLWPSWWVGLPLLCAPSNQGLWVFFLFAQMCRHTWSTTGSWKVSWPKCWRRLCSLHWERRFSETGQCSLTSLLSVCTLSIPPWLSNLPSPLDHL